MRHHLFPTKQNLGKPTIFSLGALLIVVAVASGVLLLHSIVQKLAFTRSQFAAVMLSVVQSESNAERSQHGVAPLRVNQTLARAAQAKADDMAAKGYFAHQGPDGSMAWDWMHTAGYEYEYAGENLAVDFEDSTQLVNAWMASPTHRENLLNQQYTEFGVGMAEGHYEGRKTTFVVQFFASPQKVVQLSPAEIAYAETLAQERTVEQHKVAPAQTPTEKKVAVSVHTQQKRAPVAKTPPPVEVETAPEAATSVPVVSYTDTSVLQQPTPAEPSNEVALGPEIDAPVAATAAPQGKVLGVTTTGVVSEIMASPVTYANYFLLTLLLCFMFLVVVNLLPIHESWMHRDAVARAACCVVTLVLLFAMNGTRPLLLNEAAQVSAAGGAYLPSDEVLFYNPSE